MPHEKDKTRQRRRRESAVVRESIALEMLAKGRRHTEIAETCGVSVASVTAILRRGLARRAAEEGPTVDQAKYLYVARLTELLRAWWPRANGTDDEDGNPLPPDPRAAEIVLKIIDRLGTAELGGTPGSEDPMRMGRVDVFHHSDEMQNNNLRTILAGLAALSTKQQVIDGHLATAETSLDQLTAHPELDRRPAPPPQEEAA